MELKRGIQTCLSEIRQTLLTAPEWN